MLTYADVAQHFDSADPTTSTLKVDEVRAETHVVVSSATAATAPASLRQPPLQALQARRDPQLQGQQADEREKNRNVAGGKAGGGVAREDASTKTREAEEEEEANTVYIRDIYKVYVCI